MNYIPCKTTPRKDLSGKTFGRLLVIEPAGKTKGAKGCYVYRCVCVCGAERFIRGSNLTNGHTSSCGCLNREISSKVNTVHGDTNTQEYSTWEGIKQRCLNKNSTNFKHYGGRGIKICNRWANSFEAFLKDMGRKPNDAYQINRTDNNKGYEPGNCEWVTRSENNLNKRTNRIIEFKGEKKTLTEWSKSTGIGITTLHGRLDTMAWSISDALTKPVQRRSA